MRLELLPSNRGKSTDAARHGSGYWPEDYVDACQHSASCAFAEGAEWWQVVQQPQELALPHRLGVCATSLDEAAVTEVDNDVLKLGTWTAGARTGPHLFVRVVLPPCEWQHTAAR